MVAGKNSKCFVTDPVWHLGSTPMDTVSSLDILGVTFNSTHKYDNHVNTRIQQGNSVARDLPRTGSETNTTIFVIYILDIDSHCTIWGNHLQVNFM